MSARPIAAALGLVTGLGLPLQSKIEEAGIRVADKKEEPSQLIPQAVREALDSVVAPNVRDALLKDALRESLEPELPTDPERLRSFVEGPLKSSLIRTLGSELGESVVVELDRLAALVSVVPAERRSRSGGLRSTGPAKRRASPPPRTVKGPSLVRRSATPRPGGLRASARSTPTFPPPPASAHSDLQGSIEPMPNVPITSAHAPTIPVGKRVASQQAPPVSADYPRGTAETFGMVDVTTSMAPSRRLPFVLVATQDVNLVRKLAAWLDPRAAVVRVRSAAALIHDLENAADTRSVIVLDCTNPSIRPVALAALADDLPQHTQVVLWGATSEVEEQLRGVLPVRSRWITINGAAQPKDVAARCAELVC